MTFRHGDIFYGHKVIKANLVFMYEDFSNARQDIINGNYKSAVKEYASMMDIARECREICLTEIKIPKDPEKRPAALKEQKKCLNNVYAETKYAVETLEEEYVKKCGILKQKSPKERIRHEFEGYDDDHKGLL